MRYMKHAVTAAAMLAVLAFAGSAAAAPPKATTDLPTNVTGSTATLNATVDPGGKTTTITFFYGRGDSGGSKTVILSKSGSGNVSVEAPIARLSSERVYNFRVKAQNADGSAEGTTRTFKTGSNGAAWIQETEIEGELLVGPLEETTAFPVEGTLHFELMSYGSKFDCDFTGSATLSPSDKGQLSLALDRESCKGTGVLTNCQVLTGSYMELYGLQPKSTEEFEPAMQASQGEIVRGDLEFGFNWENCIMGSSLAKFPATTVTLPSFPGDLTNLPISGTGTFFGPTILSGSMSILGNSPSEKISVGS